MHEMAIVESIMDILDQQVKIHNAKKIIAINLEFGTLTGVLPSAVEFAFEVLSKGTMAEGASLVVVIIPVKIRCGKCGSESILDEFAYVCPKCSSDIIEIVEGRNEMRVASIELEN